ncbi:M48 family metalloprotease [Dysgonomonas gadei]|uniref:Peptidase M48 domain-containing protein n=1 Tax=Dysgonomonas gadei ATCC BAA-286 TaxID=742766 RepID=F5ISK1_9BACT|nr:M48 family metallopeptidase [Dysgonomonas gadei]EGK01946.1 hypothetical protein HMPREF9455_00068 [Dysgonomonas gadei ATCC BAA-286]
MNIQLSDNFKKMTFKAIFAIIIFIFVYLLLLVSAIALTILCALGGIGLIIVLPKFFTILLGVGLASLGFLVLIFLFKFLFKKHKVDRSHLTEIHRDEYPLLFKVIEDIANEAKTKFPKKVYLSGDVNAAVFYDSSFWSMFFPIRKNLQIGLGLVNTVTEQELKAILAHEFGHFSQRSMSVGSYVYNVNEVIFNMLYDNESFDKMIQSWANISGYFSIFVIIAVKIIQGIQWVLRKMYGFVNVRYMALSREMEFHADQVAANIAGSLPLEESLLRMTLAQYSYNLVLDSYGNKIENNIKSQNIYKEQFAVMNFLAEKSKISFKNNLPMVSIIDLNKYNKSKLNIEDQWASHPGTEERVTALKRLNIQKEKNSNNPASDLFPNIDDTEEKFTENIFSNVVYKDTVTIMKPEEFINEFTDGFNKNAFPEEYNGYYDSKNPLPFDIESFTNMEEELMESVDTIFSKDKIDNIYGYIALENDKDILNAIRRKEIVIKTFDYDGQRYKSKDCTTVLDRIEEEMAILKSKIENNDINIYKFFYNQAYKTGKEHELKGIYIHYFEQDKECDKGKALYKKFEDLTYFMRVATPYEQIKNNFKLISHLEPELKYGIKLLLENPKLSAEMSKPTRDNFERYLSHDWIYFSNDTYEEDNLQILLSSINDFIQQTMRCNFLSKFDLLRYQIELLKN